MYKNLAYKFSGFVFLTFLVVLVFAAQAAYPMQADLSVYVEAQISGNPTQEANPGQAFQYVITVSNSDPANNTPEVVVTDKLPYDVEYMCIYVDPLLGPSNVTKFGDLIYVRFDEIPANTTGNIVINVTAPAEAPTTLYNIVNLGYGDDPNPSDNSMTISTYVPQPGYDQTEAAMSFEDLLHIQSQLLFQFEDMLHTIPASPDENYTFLVSFEQHLRSQANLTSRFENLLTNANSTGWDAEYSEENRTALLWSYKQMLYDEAFLFASFHAKISDSWISMCGCAAPGHSQYMHDELKASFEDLLKRQTKLYKSFYLLLNKVNISDHNEILDLLAAYDNLLRVEANLLRSFSDMLSMEYEGKGPCNITCKTPPKVTVQRQRLGPGQSAFSVTVSNEAGQPMDVTNLIGSFYIVDNKGITFHLGGGAANSWTLDNAVANGEANPASASRAFDPAFVIPPHGNHAWPLNSLIQNPNIKGGLDGKTIKFKFTAMTSCGTSSSDWDKGDV